MTDGHRMCIPGRDTRRACASRADPSRVLVLGAPCAEPTLPYAPKEDAYFFRGCESTSTTVRPADAPRMSKQDTREDRRTHQVGASASASPPSRGRRGRGCKGTACTGP
jgi:hypothetical protein